MRGPLPGHRRPRLRAQPHPLGHDRADRAAAAQPRLADRPAPAAARHLRHRGRGATANCGTSPSTPSRRGRERRPAAGPAGGRAAGLPGLRRGAVGRGRRGSPAPPATASTGPARATSRCCPPGHRPPSGDSAEMVADRVAFLEAGHYAGVTRALADAVRRRAGAGDAARPRRRHRPPPRRRPRRGCPTRSAWCSTRRPTPPAGPPAPIRGRSPWWPTPGRGCRCADGAVDRVLVVFAPRNGPEIARVLRPRRPARRRHAGAPTTWASWSGRWACCGSTRTRRPGWPATLEPHLEPVGDGGAPRAAPAGPGGGRDAGGHGAARPAPGRGTTSGRRWPALPEPLDVTVSVQIGTYRPAS